MRNENQCIWTNIHKKNTKPFMGQDSYLLEYGIFLEQFPDISGYGDIFHSPCFSGFPPLHFNPPPRLLLVLSQKLRPGWKYTLPIFTQGVCLLVNLFNAYIGEFFAEICTIDCHRAWLIFILHSFWVAD